MPTSDDSVVIVLVAACALSVVSVEVDAFDDSVVIVLVAACALLVVSVEVDAFVMVMNICVWLSIYVFESVLVDLTAIMGLSSSDSLRGLSDEADRSGVDERDEQELCTPSTSNSDTAVIVPLPPTWYQL